MASKNKKSGEELDLIRDFNARERAFILHYLGDACEQEDATCDGDCRFHKSKSGLAAGYSKQNAPRIYSVKPMVQKYINNELEKRLPPSTQLLSKLSDIAFDSDVQPRDQIKAIQEILKVVESHKTEVTHKFDSRELESLLGIDVDAAGE